MRRQTCLSAAQKTLVEKARRSVTRLAASVARQHGTRNADDLTQLGMLTAAELVDRYEASAGASFTTFIFRTVRRVMVAACVAERRGPHDPIEASDALGMACEAASPEEMLVHLQERARLVARVDRAMARLEQEDRALVLACECDGGSLASAARSLGLEYDSARYRLKLARASLSKWLRAA